MKKYFTSKFWADALLDVSAPARILFLIFSLVIGLVIHTKILTVTFFSLPSIVTGISSLIVIFWIVIISSIRTELLCLKILTIYILGIIFGVLLWSGTSIEHQVICLIFTGKAILLGLLLDVVAVLSLGIAIQIILWLIIRPITWLFCDDYFKM